jgi:rhodanese-related sulfurtransferase
MKMHLMCALALAGLFSSSALAADLEVPVITHEELKAAIADKQVTLIDANGSASYIEAHIPNAIDYQTNHAKLGKLLPANKSALIVTYGAHERCGAYRWAVELAHKLGYTNIRLYSPGIEGWKARETIVKN